MPEVSFVILQPTPFCNIACKYCYLPDRSSTARMSFATIERVFSELFSLGWAAKDVYLIWHAGEPLVLPIDYYEEAFACVARFIPPDIQLRHGMQTNGMLIDDAWCNFFRSHRVAVGVSIDGPADLHDANRITRSGKPTFEETVAGVRCLRRNDVEFGVITVLTAASLSRARDLFEFYQREGIKSVCFNVEEIEGVNTTSSLAEKGKQQAYEDFLREFWNLNVATNSLSYIREFKHMMQKIVQPVEHCRIDNTMVEPFQHLNVDWQGNFATFSPEFLGQRNERYGNFILGNIWHTGLAESLETEMFKRLNSDIQGGAALCRMTCEYFPVCGGGDPVNKLYENGTLLSTETLYCRMHTKAVANVCMEVIDRTAASSSAAHVEHVSGGVTPADPGLVLLFLDSADVDEHLEVCTGGGAFAPAQTPWRYQEGAIVPRADWRRLNAAERVCWVGHAPPDDFGVAIALVAVSSPLLSVFEPLRVAAKAARCAADLQPLLDSAEICEARGALVELMLAQFHGSVSATEARATAAVAVRPAGLPTATTERETNSLIGLHVDDWYSRPLTARRSSPNRICINLGGEDRFLVFINLELSRMHEMVASTGAIPKPGGTPLARQFMQLFPATPILRLRVRPGEAYIAPTENLAHDASTLGMSAFDVSLQVRGFFAPTPPQAPRAGS